MLNNNKHQNFTTIFKANFRLIVFSVCFAGASTLIILQLVLFKFGDYAPNLLAEITGMFLSNIFTLLIIDQYYRIQKEKEFARTLKEFNHQIKKLFHIYKSNFGKVFGIDNMPNTTEFLEQLIKKINEFQKNHNPENIINDFDFINYFENIGNVLHSIIHILNILPSEFEIKDYLVSFEKINTTILILKRHLSHYDSSNSIIIINDLKYLSEQLLMISKNEYFKEI